MELSIVSGTYNRLHYLQRMVTSARRAIGEHFGFEYEFVLVDGGSQDGTQAWCAEQPDIRLIQHESLLGAVKAFNDGAFAAAGEYVILANDDIEFLEDGILQCWIYMQEHSDCGIGCFYQNRNQKEWHVEKMPCVRDGKQVHEPYGQVCMVPRWLGNHVGWWCDYATWPTEKLKRVLHTYGGDNEISARIYELGFKVSPVPGARIHDNEADDELRKKNNITGALDPKAVSGHHPDSWAWGRKWRDERTKLVGPVLKDSPVFPNHIERRERILYLPIYEAGWPILKEQKRGLRLALEKIGLVVEVDYVGRNAEIGINALVGELQKICQQIKPTIVLTQLHNGDPLGPSSIIMLRGAAPQAKFVNWNGDYYPDNLLSEAGIELARTFDLQLTVNRDAVEKYQALGVTADFWQIGWEPEGVGHKAGEAYDLVFLASGYSPARQSLARKLRGLNGIKFGLYGNGWPADWTRGDNLYNFREACKVYRGAKISLGDSQWPDSGFVSNRVMQALAAGGSALAHQWFRGMEELGLVDGETVIVWRDFIELEQKLRYYLANESECQRIAATGERLALEKHSFEARVNELLAMIGSRRTEEIFESWR